MLYQGRIFMASRLYTIFWKDEVSRTLILCSAFVILLSLLEIYFASWPTERLPSWLLDYIKIAGHKITVINILSTIFAALIYLFMLTGLAIYHEKKMGTPASWTEVIIATIIAITFGSIVSIWIGLITFILCILLTIYFVSLTPES